MDYNLTQTEEQHLLSLEGFSNILLFMDFCPDRVPTSRTWLTDYSEYPTRTVDSIIVDGRYIQDLYRFQNKIK